MSRKKEKALEEDKVRAQGFQLIGEFIFWFSQLEFSIKERLAGTLKLKGGLFDVVTAPYDFAVLCTVTKEVLTAKYPNNKSEIEKVFNDCHKLNGERKRVAHGMWSQGKDGLVARHVARDTLKAKDFYENQTELKQYIEKAKALMLKVFDVPANPRHGTVERIGIEILHPTYKKPTKKKKKA